MSNVLISQTKKGTGPRITVRTLHDELNRLRERVEDLEDLRELNEAIVRNKGKRLIPWDEVKKGLVVED
jgi:hypothetical protein